MFKRRSRCSLFKHGWYKLLSATFEQLDRQIHICLSSKTPEQILKTAAVPPDHRATFASIHMYYMCVSRNSCSKSGFVQMSHCINFTGHVLLSHLDSLLECNWEIRSVIPKCEEGVGSNALQQTSANYLYNRHFSLCCVQSCQLNHEGTVECVSKSRINVMIWPIKLWNELLHKLFCF